MINIQAITNLITAFKAEIEKDSISPERLGGLLQQITDKVCIILLVSKKY